MDSTSAQTESWREELTLIGDLAAVQKQISAYVLRALDADALRDEPTAPSDEHELGVRLMDLGSKLQVRAASRAGNDRGRIPGQLPPRDGICDRPRETRKPWANRTTAIYVP